jgi:hypothetical protein
MQEAILINSQQNGPLIFLWGYTLFRGLRSEIGNVYDPLQVEICSSGRAVVDAVARFYLR